MQALQHAGQKFQTVSFNSWKFAGSQARIKKESLQARTLWSFSTRLELILTMLFRFNGRQATTRGLSVSVLNSPGMPLLTNQTSRLRYVWSSSVTVRIMFPLRRCTSSLSSYPIPFLWAAFLITGRFTLSDATDSRRVSSMAFVRLA